MGGFFGVASKTNCTLDLFYGIDYPRNRVAYGSVQIEKNRIVVHFIFSFLFC